MPDYTSAVRQATLAAARLHRDLGSEAGVTRAGGSVDIFGVVARLRVPMLLRPLNGLLGAFLSDPMPGILITTERPLSVQRFTGAHELGHFHLKHRLSLDDETILRRSPFVSRPDYDVQEVGADAFAVAFMMPRWLIHAHCNRQHWSMADLHRSGVAMHMAEVVAHIQVGFGHAKIEQAGRLDAQAGKRSWIGKKNSKHARADPSMVAVAAARS
jgi:Zn-dependent peptidase ImmA (M78 family)